MSATTTHTCTTAECGRNCRREDGADLTTYNLGGVDYDDQPCNCPDHEETL